MVHSQYWTKTREFDGKPKLNDFEIIEEEIDETLNDGEIIGEAICISVDPFIRVYPIPPGVPVLGFQILRVTKSANSKYPVGCKVLANCGWRTTCKVTGDNVWYKLEGDISETVWLGALGMPGMTAHYGLLDICSPKPGETVIVNSCAGAVGNLVGQIAKIKGCRVIGCCGSDEKIEFSKSIGFDEVFNYKTCGSYTDILKKIAPNGIDCFFDNVGGQLSSDIISCMNVGGRIAVCGAITSYNSTEPVMASMVQMNMIAKQLSMKGFSIASYAHKFPDALKDMIQKKIKVREALTTGFENTPSSFINMLDGGIIGKAVVVV
ncbi:prostaglandin reductase 1-like [Ciona intestinalis]